jgi:murein DD-endopeptidase MepM/ murein hydrolase activator NlpD
MVGVFFCLAIRVTAGSEPARGWPPEPLVEMQVPLEPTAFPADGRHYLVYELRLTNLASTPATVRRLDVRDANAPAAPALASYDGPGLDGILQHYVNPAVGDRMPTAGLDYRQLAPGESVLVFLTVVLESGVPVPAQLVHQLQLEEGTIRGASAGTQGSKLLVLSAPLSGGPWQAFSGAGNNQSHHRRQFVVLSGRTRMPTRHAIDWKRMDYGSPASGAGDANSDYFSYGQPVLAVASGRIVAVRDGIADNHPGHVGAESFHLTRETLGGNFIVLELGNGQYAQYMHLEPGSLRVTVGQRVRRGDTIGLVGSSGSSFEPHLHFQVADSAEPVESEGLPYVIDEFQSIDGGNRVQRRRQMPLEGWLIQFP